MKVFLACCVAVFVSACTPRSFEVELERAQGFIGSGDFSGALNIYHRLIDDDPRDHRIAALWVMIGEVEEAGLLEPERAFVSFGQAIAASPFSEEARLAHERRALIKEAEGDAEGVVAEYSELVKHFPNHPQQFWYRLRIAEGFLMGRRYDEARTDLARLEKEKLGEDVREELLFVWGESFYLEGRPSEAYRVYQYFLNRYPKSSLASEARLKMAGAAEELGYLGLAKRLLLEARKNYPKKEVIDARIADLERHGKSPSQPNEGKKKKGRGGKGKVK